MVGGVERVDAVLCKEFDPIQAFPFSFIGQLSKKESYLFLPYRVDSYLYSFSGEGRQPALQETRILLFQTFSYEK